MANLTEQFNVPLNILLTPLTAAVAGHTVVTIAPYNVQHCVPAVGLELPVSLLGQNRVRLSNPQPPTGSFTLYEYTMKLRDYLPTSLPQLENI